MARSSVHVVPHQDGWAVRMEGSKDVASVHPRQHDAITKAMEMAQDDESDLIVHRRDGKFDEVMKFNDIKNEDVATLASQWRVHDMLPVRSRVSWGAILAGLVTAFTVNVLLGSLGAAVGLSASQNVGGQNLVTGAAIWALLSILIALFLGGYVTSRISVGENQREAAMYGVMLWGTLCVALLALPTAMVNDPGFGGLMQRSRAAVVVPESSPYTPAMFEQAGLNVSEEQAANLEQARLASTANIGATEAAWWTFAGLLLSLIASVAGSYLGAGPEFVLERIRSGRRGTAGGIPVETHAVPKGTTAKA